MNPDGDDDFLGALQMDDQNLMMVDEILEFVKNDPDFPTFDTQHLQNTKNDSFNVDLRDAFGEVDIKQKNFTVNIPNVLGFSNAMDDIDIKDETFSMPYTQSSTFASDSADTQIDPNDFFNDMYKSEVDYSTSSTFSSPSYRSTPSPTTSNSSQSSSSEQLTYDYNKNTVYSENPTEMSMNLYNSRMQTMQQQPQFTQYSQPMQNYHIETPPISPPTDIDLTTTTLAQQHTHSQAIPVINPMMSTQTTQSVGPANVAAPNQINIIQGTLIPLKALSLSPPRNKLTSTNAPQVKKIRIQPKPTPIVEKPPIVSQHNTLSIQKPTQPKTIVLSASDYKALMLKCKSQQNATGTGANDKITTLPILTNAKVSSLTPNQNQKMVKLISSAPISPSNINTTPTASIQPARIALNAPEKLNDDVPNDRNKIASINQKTVTKPFKPKLSHDEFGDRTLKKQMRMIKNRESACLSRKKKKEYVTTLETRLMDLSKENQQLKSENSALKDRLSQATRKICDLCGNIMSSSPVKHSNTLTALRNVPKKNAAFLLAFVFMITLNFGLYLPFRSPETINYGDQSVLVAHPHQIGTRGLLWIDDSDKNSSLSSETDGLENNEKTYPMCPVAAPMVNQTESIRLADELQRWIGDLPEYFNLTKLSAKANADFDLKKISDYLLSDTDDDSAAFKSFYRQIKSVRNYIRKAGNQPPKQTLDKNKGFGGMLKQRRKINKMAKETYEIGNSKATTATENGIDENRVQIYSPVYSNAIKYAEFFEEIHRQDDTFYVVSLSGDHLLLPAPAHNKTFRPKMSLMLPAVGNTHENGSVDGVITLMQIDCEVVNTSILRIKESSIPAHLRNRSSAAMPNPKSSSQTSSPIPNATSRASRSPTAHRSNIKNRRTDSDTLPQMPTNIIQQLNRNDLGINITNAKENSQRIPHKPLPVDDYEHDNDADAVKPYKPYFLDKPQAHVHGKVLSESENDLL